MSFKRKEQTQIVQSGTRQSPLTSSVLNVSTGIPSLDDVLGCGLPLGSVLVVLAPDSNTAYSDLVQRYFVAQGIASGQYVCILDDSAFDLVSSCMWIPSTGTSAWNSGETDEETKGHGGKSAVKIAWRYENMKKFQTSVNHTGSTNGTYCYPLDLMCRIPEQVLNASIASQQLQCLSVSSPMNVNPIDNVIARLDGALSEMEGTTSVPIRLSIPSLGSPQWGDVSPSGILRLLHFVRSRVRQGSNVAPRICAFITLPSYLSQDDWGGPGWWQRVGWLSDGCITLRSFSSDPALLSMFPSHHGLVDVHSLPAPHALIPASDKFSELRGLATFSSSAAGGGENNLAFKCTRKRFIIETLHLDAEGGVNERRTTAPATPDVGLPSHSTTPPIVQVSASERVVTSAPKKKVKKSVAFQSDRPDLYDF